MKILRTTILTVTLLAFLSVPALAQTRIATVDLSKLFDNFYKTKLARVSIQETFEQFEKEDKGMRDDLQKADDDYKQLLDKANDMALSDDERSKNQQAADAKLKDLQNQKATMVQFESENQTRLAEKRKQMRADILKEIQAAVTAKAQAAGYSLVLDTAAETVNGTPAIVYSNNENDLTDAVLTQLNVGAPANIPAPAPTQIPAPSLMDTNTP